MKHISTKTDRRGFTLVELIAILIIVGIAAAVVISRVTGTSETNMMAQVNVIKNHIRYAQSMAMKRGTIWGIRCDGADYWLFRNEAPPAPVTTTNQVALPEENSEKITLADKKITMSVFTVFFDATGRPYTAYTDENTNTPLDTPLSITVNSVPAGNPAIFAIAPETGFMP